MTLKELLKETDISDVISEISKYNIKKTRLEKYKKLYKELLNKNEIHNSNIKIFAVNQKAYIDNDNIYTEVFGYDIKLNEIYALDLTKREEILGYEIVEKSIKTFGKINFIIECLKTISSISFDEEIVKKEKNTLNEIIKEIESGKAKTFTHEEVVQELNEELGMDIKIKEYSIEEKEEMSKKFKEIKEYNDNEIEKMLSEIKR